MYTYKNRKIIAFGYNYIVVEKKPDLFDNNTKEIIYLDKYMIYNIISKYKIKDD